MHAAHDPLGLGPTESGLKIAVVLPAAGTASRYAAGSDAPRSKLDEDLGGRPVLHRTIELFADRPDVVRVIVAGPADDQRFEDFKRRHADKIAICGGVLLQGGATRARSVQAALVHVPKEATRIAVHDAARPCTPAALIDRLFAAAKHHDAVIPALPLSDTIKSATDEVIEPEQDPLSGILDSKPEPPMRTVDRTLDRAALFAAQTPQVFEAELLRKAYAAADGSLDDPASATDDAGLVERLGTARVILAAGDPRNIKITLPNDLTVARALLGHEPPQDKPVMFRF